MFYGYLEINLRMRYLANTSLYMDKGCFHYLFYSQLVVSKTTIKLTTMVR